MSIAGTILAGGLSRRMGGGDKSMLSVAGQTMLSRVIERFRPQVDVMALNANGDPQRFSETGLPVISDPIAGFAGPLAGILAGLNWASSLDIDATHIVSVASDTPFFPVDLAARFMEVNEDRPDGIVLATCGGNRHPVFGLWPLSLNHDLAQFMEQTDTYKVLAYTDRHDLRFADFPVIDGGGTTIDPFFNANTPDDIETAEKLALETVS